MESRAVRQTPTAGPATLERATLVYGPRKAGTTLLQRLIDGADLYVYPTELKTKMYVKASWTDRSEFINRFSAANLILKRQFDNFQSDLYKEIVSRSLSDVRGLRDLILADVSAAIECSPARPWIGWAAKDVGGDFNTILRDWKKMFPDSRLVVIVRDPFFVTRSVFRERRRAGRRLTLKALIKEIVDPWRVTEMIDRHAGRRDVHVLHYEDLVAHTEEQMRAVAKFLGMEFVPILTQPTLFGEPVVVKTSSRQDKSVFRESAAYWSGLTAAETILLTAIGGAFLAKNLWRRRVRFKSGGIRLRRVK